MPGVDALLSTLEWFAAALSDSYATNDVLQTLVDHVGLAVGVTGAGVLLLRQGRFVYVTSTLGGVADLGRLVEAEQRGPCVEVGQARRPVAIRDIFAGSFPARFPSYVEQARASGVRAVAVVPMALGERTVGVLGLYDHDPRDWSEDELRVAGIVATIAGGHVAAATAVDDQRRLAQQLQHALTSRVVIEQAKGITAVERGVGVDQAFALLRKEARDTNRRLHDVCAEVVSLHRG